MFIKHENHYELVATATQTPLWGSMASIVHADRGRARREAGNYLGSSETWLDVIIYISFIIIYYLDSLQLILEVLLSYVTSFATSSGIWPFSLSNLMSCL